MLKMINVILKIILILLVIFWISDTIGKKTEPQQEMEDKARAQAQKYLDVVFMAEHFVIKEMTFDPTHSLYNYAAVVRNEENNIEFRVYLNNYSGKMDDDYVAMKWKDDLSDDILPFIKENYGEDTTFFVGYEDAEINEDNINPNKPGDYKDYDGKPTISVFVQHSKKAESKNSQSSLIGFLKKECGLKHALVNVDYYKNHELLKEDGWIEGF